LIIACGQGKESLVKILIEAGADVNMNVHESCTCGRECKCDCAGVTALIIASGQGKESLVKILIEARADVNAKGSGWTPLMKASKSGYKSIVEALLTAGADANPAFERTSRQVQAGWIGTYAEFSYYPPLTLACEGGHQDVAKMLLDAGANPNSVDILARVLNVKGYSKAVYFYKLAQRSAVPL
jgi:ankyrin repeat protein